MFPLILSCATAHIFGAISVLSNINQLLKLGRGATSHGRGTTQNGGRKTEIKEGAGKAN